MKFLQFCDRCGFEPENANIDQLAAFVEFLVLAGYRVGTIKNYMSAMVTLFKIWGCDTAVFNSFRWELLGRGIVHTVRAGCFARPGMLWEDLLTILRYCKGKGGFVVLHLALTFSFAGFLRISNVAPRSTGAFDTTRDATMGDVHRQGKDIRLDLKWTKTRQAAGDATSVTIAKLEHPLADPVRTWGMYVKALDPRTLKAGDPLLLTTAKPTHRPVSQLHLRAMFRQVLVATGLSSRGYSWHSLRRGAATAAYQNGASIPDIMRHGTWRSQAVARYLGSQPVKYSSVTSSLQKLSSAVC